MKLTATHIQPIRLPLTREIKMTVLLLMEMLKASKHLIPNPMEEKFNLKKEKCSECFNVSFIFKVNQSQLLIIKSQVMKVDSLTKSGFFVCSLFAAGARRDHSFRLCVQLLLPSAFYISPFNIAL